jgi:hypothetical protein
MLIQVCAVKQTNTTSGIFSPKKTLYIVISLYVRANHSGSIMRQIVHRAEFATSHQQRVNSAKIHPLGLSIETKLPTPKNNPERLQLSLPKGDYTSNYGRLH